MGTTKENQMLTALNSPSIVLQIRGKCHYQKFLKKIKTQGSDKKNLNVFIFEYIERILEK